MGVVVEERGSVAWIRLDDGKANALGPEVLTALDEALEGAREAKAVVLTGRPGKLSGGFDLKHMMQGPAEARALVSQGARAMMKLYGFPRPVVAACPGHAVAGGALLLLCCDVRLGVAGEAKIGLNETAVGLTLPGFALGLARERLDPRHLTRATMAATMYSPDQAVVAGFLDRVVAADSLEALAQEEALRLGALAAPAYAGSKAGLRAGFVERTLAELEENLEAITRGVGAS